MKNRFAAMHDWPVLIVRALTAVLNAEFEVGARHDDERIAAAEFEHAFLDFARGRARHRAAGFLAAGQRDGFDARIDD